jgi:uncharacterized protein YbaR (Trm112 family)
VELDPGLLRILACPVDKGSLLYFAGELALYNPRLRRRYLIQDGVPVMLAQHAENVTAEEHSRLLAHASEGKAVLTLSAGASPA